MLTRARNMAQDPRNKRLTDRQRHVLDVVLEYQQTHAGKSPTIREIMRLIGVSSGCTVQRHLDALEKKGVISRERYQYRSIQVLTGPSYRQIHAELLDLAAVAADVAAGVLEPRALSAPLARLQEAGWSPRGEAAGEVVRR